MRATRIATIVEGVGEVRSIRLLLSRIATEMFDQSLLTGWPEILEPCKRLKNDLVHAGEIEQQIDRIANQHGSATKILVLVDADDDCTQPMS